jgi:hypothetical protein
MKDAKGHGSNPRGAHAEGVQKIGRYLRFGPIPKNERSHNHAMGTIEKGVSVYELDENDNPIVPTKGEWAADDLAFRQRRETGTRYIVQGDRVGTGHDGEPLLRNVRIVKDISEEPKYRWDENNAREVKV